MNNANELVNKIFENQENSYEAPRYGEQMAEFVDENIGIGNKYSRKYDSLLDRLKGTNNEDEIELLMELDNHLNDYQYVRNEFEELDWDILFGRKLQNLLRLIGYSSQS